jgi:hypothetical protein
MPICTLIYTEVRHGKNWAETGYFSKKTVSGQFLPMESDVRNGKNWAETVFFPK